MSDTRGNQDLLSLDEAIDDLLRQSSPTAEAAPASTDPAAVTPRPEGAESSDGDRAQEAALADASHENAGNAGGGHEGDATEPRDTFSEGDATEDALASSLDSLLKQADDLQASVSAVAPRVDDAVPPPPAGADPAAPTLDTADDAESDGASGEGAESEVVPETDTGAESESAPSLQSLDAELAALTDDLLAGEIEGAAESVPADATAHSSGAPGADAASTSVHSEHASGAAIGAVSVSGIGNTASGATKSTSAVAQAGDSSGAAKRARRVPAIGRALALIARTVAAPILATARAILGLAAAPLRGKRTLQQSIGWLASYTLFLAGGLWIYLLAFHTPEVPHASGSPSGLHGSAHHGDAHGSDAHGSDPHGHDAHGQDAHGGGEHGDDHGDGQGKGHAPEDHGDSPGSTKAGAAHGAPSGDASHGASDKGASHGSAKKDAAHGGGGHDGGAVRVVNGYAISKSAASKKGGAAAGKKDDGHGAKKDDGHGAKKSGGH